jgi:hypothetical protein
MPAATAADMLEFLGKRQILALQRAAAGAAVREDLEKAVSGR